MEEDRLFAKFYREYLGLGDGGTADSGGAQNPAELIYKDVHVYKCRYRDIPLNKHYFYKAVATYYHGEKILSCSPDWQETDIKFLCANIKFAAIGSGNVPKDLEIPGYELSYMDRMLLNPGAVIGMEERLACPRESAIAYQYLEKYNKWIALADEAIVGYCKVSDFIAGYGNLVVWVEEARRRQGMAEHLVRLMLKKCEEQGIAPMYLVKTDNHASLALAKKLGFAVRQRELVVSRNTGI